jgi:hypothetical protein
MPPMGHTATAGPWVTQTSRGKLVARDSSQRTAKIVRQAPSHPERLQHQPLAGTVGNVIAVRSRRWHPPGSVIVGLASVLAAVVAISGCGQRDQNNPQSGVAERREQPPPSERNQDLLSDKASRATPTKPPNESKPTTGEWTPSAEKDGVGRGSGDSQEPRASRKSAGGRADGGGQTSSLLGSTPSVDSPEGRRLLRESPDCRDAPPPPPGYSGPVQC